jgi:peroxiredoxin
VQLQNIEPQLIQLGYQIIAISPDRPIKLAKTIRKHKLNYLLLSDSKMKAARAFGIAFRVAEKALKRNNFDRDLEDASGEKHHLLPVPAAFIIGTDGIIKFEYVNPNYTVRIKPDLLLAAAKATLDSKEAKQK